MKCIVLAAGYATRLYPLTENFPKSLLKICDKTIIDWLLDDLDKSGVIDEYILVSNHKYYKNFCDWAENSKYNIRILDDGTTTNENRLGAVMDITFAIEELNIDDDILVVAGDNVLDFSLSCFISYAVKKGNSCIMRYFEPDMNRLVKCGVVDVDSDDRIISMTEKSKTPKTNWCCPPFYYYKKDDIRLFREAIDSGCPTDAPGSFVAWLCSKRPVYAMEMPGNRYDIGDLKSYEKVQMEYKGILKK